MNNINVRYLQLYVVSLKSVNTFVYHGVFASHNFGIVALEDIKNY
jgi:hypothetical protein